MANPLGLVHTMNDLKSYVSEGPSYHSGQRKADTTVLLNITHSNLTARFSEIRLDLHDSILEVKETIRQKTGTAVDSQKLLLKNSSGALIAELSDDSRKLGYYSAQDGWIMHVIDIDPYSVSSAGALEDTSLVKKFELTDEEYANRKDSYRSWKGSKLSEDPNWTLSSEMQKRRDPTFVPPVKITEDSFGEAEAVSISVGARCEVFPGSRRATVRYVGKIPELGLGWWIGVEYDEPVGKNDGSAPSKECGSSGCCGIRYFECSQNYGGFVRPQKVTIGDFPNADDDLFDDLQEE